MTKSGFIDTTLAELYKMGPGPSSSHTMGPMLASLDFYQTLQILPDEVLAQATGIKVVLYGSLSATGKGHGTDRAVLAGLLGKMPEKCEPEFLDQLADSQKTYSVVVRQYSWPVSLGIIEYGPSTGSFPHPNTIVIKLAAGEQTLFEREYYSVGGGFIEWKGQVKPSKGEPPYLYSTMKELQSHVSKRQSLVFVLLHNEMALTGHSESEVWTFLDRVIEVMCKSVSNGLEAQDVLPGPIGLHSKAATLFRHYNAEQSFSVDKAITALSALAVAAGEENARGHVIVTAPTAGSAGVMAAAVHTIMSRPLGNRQLVREGLLTAAAIGYLCKHNATLSGAEGGCQAEIGVASAMAAAFLAHVRGSSVQVMENAAESALEHHLGLTCDPVGGYVQVPCIERCAFGVIKAWTACCIAWETFPETHKVDFDTVVAAMELTAKAMSSKYKETSEGGLAKALVYC